MRIFGFNITRADSSEPLSLKTAESALERQQSSLALTGVGSSGAPDNSSSRLATNSNDLAGKGAERKSFETLDNWSGITFWNAFSARKRNGGLGLAPSFDIQDFANLDFDYLAELLADLSPEVSKALWDFLLLCNSGYECKAYKPGTRDVDEPAQETLNQIMDVIKKRNGTCGVFFDRLFKTLFLRGSILLELILHPNGYDFANIATPDTKTLDFRRIVDPVLGQVWDFGQRQRGVFVSLDIPTIAYVPVHPGPDSIEGHSLCSAAFFPAIFLMSVLRDTKRVVQHQGYMRLDVEVMFDKLKDTMPEDLSGNPEKTLEWMNKVVADVQAVYENLKPDDTYIHSDTVKINAPVGTVNADSLRGIDSLFQTLERMLVRALKTMPLLMASNQSRSETQANREWEIYAQGIGTVQHFVESGFEHVVGLALQAAGHAVDVELRFAQFRSAEKMRDAQVDALISKTARQNYESGYISQDEAAQAAVGRDVADVPEPRSGMMSGAPDNSGQNDNPNPGESRFTKRNINALNRFLAGERDPSLPELVEAEEFLEQYAPDLLSKLYDAEVAE